MPIKKLEDNKIIQTPPTPKQTPVGNVASKSTVKAPLNFPKADNQSKKSDLGALDSEKLQNKSVETPQIESKSLADTKHSTVKESPIEKEINAYIEENNLSSMNIDDLRVYLLKKKNKTQKELGILAKIQAQFEEVPKEHSVHKKHEPLVSVEEMLDSNWIKKDAKEKMSIVADKYFEKTDANYKNLSPEEKTVLKQKQFASISQDLKGEKDTPQESALKVLGLLEALNDKKMSIDEYNKLSKDERVKIYRDHQAETLKNIKDLVSTEFRQSKKWRKMSSDDKLKLYAEKFLEKEYPNFSAKTKEDKQKFIDSKAQELIASFVPGWDKMDDSLKDTVFSSTLMTIDALTSKGISYDEFKNLDERSQFGILKQSCKDEKALMQLSVTKDVFEFIKKYGKTPTVADLEKMNKQSDLPREIRERKAKFLESQKDLKGEKTLIGQHGDINVIASNNNKTVEQEIFDRVNDIKSLKPEEQKAELRKLYSQTMGDKDYIDYIDKLTGKNGLSKVARKVSKEMNLDADMVSCAVLNDDSNAYNSALDRAMANKNTRVAKVAAAKVTKYLTEEKSQDVGVHITNDIPQLVDNFSTGVNKYVENPVQYTSQFVQREDLSESGRARFTKSVVETAPTPERQKAYAKELSGLGNESVNEGLAAASRSVDKSVRSEYNSYIQDAIKNYPPEKQAAIQNAMKTGEISQETLAKNTVSVSETSNGSKNQPSQQSSATSQSVAKSSKTVSQSGGKSQTVSAQTTVSSASSKTTTRTSVSQNSVAQEVKALQQKKDALINKITTYETTKAEKTIEREKAKAEKVQTPTSSKNSETASVSEKTATKSTENAKTTDNVENLKLSEDEQNTLKEIITDLFQQNSVSAAYSQINDEIKDKFMQAFATQGKESDVISFANDYKGNPDTIVKLINYCNNDGLKLDLTRLLPSSRINEIISSGKLSSNNISKLAKEGKVDNKILMEYLKNNKDSMTYDQIKEYMKYMPLDYSSEIYDLLKAIPGSPEWEEANNNNMKTAITSDTESNTAPSLDDGIAIGSNKMAMRGQYDKMKRKGPFYLNA